MGIHSDPKSLAAFGAGDAWSFCSNKKEEDKMKVNWKDHIVSTPDVIRGKPRIKGTRIPASLILGYFAAGNTIEEIIDQKFENS
jgi:hypothetical protein